MNEQERNDMIREYYLRQLEQNGGCAGPMLTLVLLVVLLLVGCRTTEYITVPEVHTEYVYRDRVDSVAVHDSVYIKEQMKGDAVTRIEYRYRDRFRYIERTDTVTRCDTVSVVHTQVVEHVTNKMNSVQSAFFWLGLLAFLLLIGYIAFRILRWRYHS